ncbi:hypothetical protein OG252_45155 [Streptomyces sp. NBC_01352]|uniref:hypothetical protein n=1 Tax=Streptomyces sp. NBC_01352 TaxID=2903834 RepID=UPI002E3068E1|nr:hypothetical protein [Streptomyces sp. NBC_01352]
MAHVWLHGHEPETVGSDDPALVLVRADTLLALSSTSLRVTGRLHACADIVLAQAQPGSPLPGDFHLGLVALLGRARQMASCTGDDIVLTVTQRDGVPEWTLMRAEDLW